ncbi:unnamed protein product [Spirodela intermedia]|uniref:FAD-binding domain-containing protein n=1 Tax=Spirodela intermedia TaxID=51605 RepID=A0A7I8ILY5_SPIIN|nr:unnamed protein product [Spirodela intermedia]CAA6658887.1 unnamed protein product [Spirodela intermedia]
MSEDRLDVEVAIVGAGIAGCIVVVESAAGLRSTGAALGLFPNAWRALDVLGIAHKLIPLYPPLRKFRVTHTSTGETQEVSLDGAPVLRGMEVRVVHRRALLESLAEELPPGTIRFSSKLTSITRQKPTDASSGSGCATLLELSWTIRPNSSNVELSARAYLELLMGCQALIGCDGVHSAVARWLGLSTPIDSGRGAVRGLSVYPDGHGFSSGSQQFLGKNERTGFFPMNDKEIYWFITRRSNPSDDGKGLPPAFRDVVNHSELSTVSWAPLKFRLPWDVVVGPTHRGSVAVAGDAMHPMTPDLGQGGCAALEDAVVLGRNIAATLHIDGSVDAEKVERCLDDFVRERRWRAAGLIAGAYVSGRIQQGGSGWWESAVKFIRDGAFYRYMFPRIVSSVVGYDCGPLPITLVPA